MNYVILIGNVTADPVVTEKERKQKDDILIANFTIAVRRDEDTTDFIRCTAFNRTAEIISKYVSKGDKLGVCGELHIDQVANDGEGYDYYTSVIVNKIDFMTKKENKDDGKKQVQIKRR